MYRLDSLNNIPWCIDVEQTIELLKKSVKPIDLLIIDHYSIDKSWELSIRKFVKKIMVIDDLADREHDYDILLDQNFHLKNEIRYNGLIPSHCKLFLGPKYVLFSTPRFSLRKHLQSKWRG
ncbi:hypothetical protein [Halalkalibacter alkalisediminis]|uniref:Uncharacterized protein n=1 Tax=Halalkalibacter alkalisediminis TaxID=935616 RepID=A0ABV6NMD1_9BACI|nr:hypothetical protein [Halalkalibacter alkalisediminis]